MGFTGTKGSCGSNYTPVGLTDTLAAAATAGAVEGDDWSFATATTRPTRLNNVTQIFRKDIAVSESQRAVNAAGFRDA